MNNTISLDELLQIPFNWDNRKQLLSFLSHKDKVRVALFCAKQVKHLVAEKNREICNKAINIAELWLVDKATVEECREAANAAVYVASAATYAAAYAASAAANAAANAAAYAATNAVYAVKAFEDKERTKQEQMLYLKELIIKAIPEEDRSWLLEMMI